jgi:hypothetical protein
MEFNLSPFWVQVHDMSLVCMHRDIGYKIGATLRVVEDVGVTGDGVGWGCCLRIRVPMDLTKPLDRGRALSLNGRSVWATFKYM